MGTESLRTYNKIEPSSCSVNNRIIQIIGFSTLLLWLVVYVIKEINFNQYENGALIDDGSLIKVILSLAALCFTVPILLGIWTYYKTKRTCSSDPSIGITSAIKWLVFGLFVLMTSIPQMFFPESDRFFGVYLIALTYAGKHVMGKISKNTE